MGVTSAVQLCSMVMWHGLGVGRGLVRGLTEFMTRKKYMSAKEFSGLSCKYLVSNDEITKDLGPAISMIDKEKCTGCKLCCIACSEAAYNAIAMKNNIAVVKRDLCSGCGLCRIVCPISGCVTIIPEHSR